MVVVLTRFNVVIWHHFKYFYKYIKINCILNIIKCTITCTAYSRTPAAGGQRGRSPTTLNQREQWGRDVSFWIKLRRAHLKLMFKVNNREINAMQTFNDYAEWFYGLRSTSF